MSSSPGAPAPGSNLVHMLPLPIIAGVLACIAICVVTDVRARRIPNLVSGPTMLVGIALNTLYFGTSGLTTSLGGLLAAMAVLIIPFALGGVGAGDVKMMGAV